MSDNPPPGDKVYFDAAKAGVDAGFQFAVGESIEANLPVYLALIAADPRFRAAVETAYATGREDAAREKAALLDALRRLRDSWYGQPGWTDAADTVDVLIDAFAEPQPREDAR